MSIAQQIDAIIDAGGTVRAANTFHVKMGSDLLKPDHATRLEPQCWDATLTVNGGANSILARAEPRGTPGTNAVIVSNEERVACAGQLSPPGFLFSDSFSGCLWFLFRDAYGSVYGVHSYRSSGAYADPTPYFDRIGAKLIYFFNSGGQFTDGTFGSVLCYVSPNKITVNFFAQQNGVVKRVVDRTRIDNWRSHQIASPTVGGALAPFVLSPAAPKTVGLKKKVVGFVLDYI